MSSKRIIDIPRCQRPLCRYDAVGGCLNINCIFLHKSLHKPNASSDVSITIEEEEKTKLKEIFHKPDYFNSAPSGKENRPNSRYKKVNLVNGNIQKNEVKERLNKRRREIEDEIVQLREKVALAERKAKKAKISQTETTVQRWMRILENVPVITKDNCPE